MPGQFNSALIVEDCPITRRHLRVMLLRMGFHRVDQAEDGEMGLSMLEDTPYDLIISDWHMPKRNGLELAREVRSNPAHDHTPFLMLTYETEKNSILTASEVGVNGYIIKPFSPIDLESKIRAAINAFKEMQFGAAAPDTDAPAAAAPASGV